MITYEQIKRLRLRDRGCQAKWNILCHGSMDHVHHRLNRSQGGTDDDDNLMMVCWWCHRQIHDHPREAYERGLLIHRWDAEDGQLKG